MNRLVRILSGVASLILVIAAPALARERIVAFESNVVIAADGGLTVTETITVDAEGDRIKRGIYRDFPTRYEGRDGRPHIVGFDVVEVLRDGRREPWFTKNRDNGVRVYIGDKNRYLRSGRYSYKLTYKTDRQLGFFADYDELYWNVTGNDWEFQIDRVRITVVPPEDATVVQKSAYTGIQGATGRDWRNWTDDQGNPVFETTRGLDVGEGLTVAVAWPKGFVDAPDALDNAYNMLRDNLVYFTGLGGLGLLFIYYLVAWIRIGRDPPKGAIIPRWMPPRGISPAAARYVKHMDFDKKVLGAAVVNLAIKGHLTIEEAGGKNYYLHERIAPVQGKMSPGEKVFKRALFKLDGRVTVEQGNHVRLKPAVDALNTALSANYEGAHFSHNFWVIIVGLLLTAAVIIGTFVVGAGVRDDSMVFLFIGMIGGGIGLNKLFTWLIKAPTLKGRRLMDEIDGFRMYLETAEKGRLDMLHPPEKTPELFEKYLPYAMALDVETEWGDQFKEVLAAAAAGQEDGYSPGWYHGRRWDHGNPGRFAGAIGGSLGGAIASAATPPGSSSGSGGGGSSGGGGGGGGGGGW